MLDLTTIKNNEYEIKWFDGQILHLAMPSQALIQKMAKLSEIKDISLQMKEIRSIMLNIFNSNIEGRVFTKEEVDEITFDIIEVIVEDYMNTVAERLGE